jgi:hypothetical protein
MDRAGRRGRKGIMSSGKVGVRRIKHSAAQDVRHSIGLVVGGAPICGPAPSPDHHSGIGSADQGMAFNARETCGGVSWLKSSSSAVCPLRRAASRVAHATVEASAGVGGRPGAGRRGFDTAGRFPVAVAHRQLRGRGHRGIKWYFPDDRHRCRARIEATQSNRCRRQLGPVPAPRSTEAISADA